MKKLRKMTVALLAVIMLLSLAAPAFASVQANPKECLHCGIGTIETEEETKTTDTYYSKVCSLGGKEHIDRQMLRETHQIERCTNRACGYFRKNLIKEEKYWVCEYAHPGA